jgi:histone H3/H4
MSKKQARAPSAYFIFCDEYRAQLQLELNEQQTDGTKVAVSAVAKALGQKWKELSEEERAKYKEQAAAHAAERAGEAVHLYATCNHTTAVLSTGVRPPPTAAVAAEEAGGGGQHAEAEAAAAGSSKGSAVGFPVAVLKRIMHADPDVTRASSDAVWAVGKAVELFVVALADKCHSAARSRKQSVVKMQDFVTTVRWAGWRRLLSLVHHLVLLYRHTLLGMQHSLAQNSLNSAAQPPWMVLLFVQHRLPDAPCCCARRTDKRLCQAGLKDIAAGVQQAAEAAAAAAAAAPPKPVPAKRAAAGGAGAAGAAAAEAAGSQDGAEAAGVTDAGEAAAAGSAAEAAVAAAAAADDEDAGRDQAAKRAKTDEPNSSKGRKKADAAAAAAKSSHKITTFFVKRPEVAATD